MSSFLFMHSGGFLPLYFGRTCLLHMFLFTGLSHHIRFSLSTCCRTNWNPIISLSLKHPTLILLEKCTNLEHFKQILAQIMRIHLITRTFPMSRLIYFSAISYPEALHFAVVLFHHFTPQPNLYIYNTMISHLPSSAESMAAYNSMLKSFIQPDKQTVISLLKRSKNIIEGKQIHGHAIVNGLSVHLYVQNSLLRMYCVNGETDTAHQMFDKMLERDVFSFNILSVAYARKGSILEALDLFGKFISSGLNPDGFTMVGPLMCCGRLRNLSIGKCIHGWIERRKSIFFNNVILSNSLLDMYVKCGAMSLALNVFKGLKEKDVISWNTLISGYTNVGDQDTAKLIFDNMTFRDTVSWNSLIAGFAEKEDIRPAIGIFKDMIISGIRADKSTVISLVCAASSMGSMDIGRWIHGWIIKAHLKIDAFLGSALINMYSKCGSIKRAILVFEQICEFDVVAWTTMIEAYGLHGYGREALHLFHKMEEHKLVPNDITFIAILTSCTHCGLVKQGQKIFESMSIQYGIQPGIEHYGCMVDLLGRAGLLKEAKILIENMPFKPSQSVWGAFLSSCRAQGNIELAKIAASELLKLEPDKEGGYILLSNTYSSCGKWNYSDKIRKIMETRGIKKNFGYSSIIIDGLDHQFIATDKRHPRWKDISLILHSLNKEMISGPDSSHFQTGNFLLES